MKDTYKTVAREMLSKCKVQRSLFIAHVRETTTEEAARDFIAEIKDEHKQATHNCSAYRVGLGNQEISFFDDDGEPSGSAGKPILGAILSRELTDVTVVVTRYFGGKKLGIRGLIEAYGAATGDGLDLAGIIPKTLQDTLSITTEYQHLDQVNHIINQHRGEIIDSDYGVQVKLTIAIPRSLAPKVEKLLTPFSS